jgi:hypothetical protein
VEPKLDLWIADVRRYRPPPKARQVRQLQGWGNRATDPSRYSLVYHAWFQTPPFDHTVISYHLYRHRLQWSVFNELYEEVGKALRLPTETQGGADQSTTVGRYVGRGGGGASAEE